MKKPIRHFDENSANLLVVASPPATDFGKLAAAAARAILLLSGWWCCLDSHAPLDSLRYGCTSSGLVQRSSDMPAAMRDLERRSSSRAVDGVAPSHDAGVILRR